MSRFLQLLIVIFSFFAGSSSTAQSIEIQFTEAEKQFLQVKKSLSMCVGPSFMPYEDIADGKHVGMIAEYMSIISNNIGIPFVLVVTQNWDETMQNARSRKCDIISFIMDTPDRRQFLNFSTHYIGEPLVIATLNDKPFVVDIGDIRDMKLGIVRGYAFVEILKNQIPGINIVEVNSIVDGLSELESGELYAYLDGLNVIGYNIQKLGSQNLKINGTLKNVIEVSIGSRNDIPIINDILNKGINTITELQRKNIENSWIKVKYEHRFDYTLIIQVSIVVILIFGFMIYHQNVLRKHNRLLEALSETDKLTNINNRLKLDRFLQYNVDLFVRYHEIFSIILIDIDHFKKFNDTFGHLIGDKVLAHVASLLKENCRKLDMIGRWGGEEFLMICPKTNLEKIGVLAEKLRSTVEKSRLQNVEGVTISLGIAQITVSDNFNTIIGRADKALFLAKQNGRNRIEVNR
jgi:polar amino acid transport system substrate-binding protein